jgi:hypothetical protein
MLAANQPSPGSATGEPGNPAFWDAGTSRFEPRVRRRAPEVSRAQLDQRTPSESSSQGVKTWKEISGTPAVFSVRHRYLGYVTAIYDDYIAVQLTDERTGEYADAEIPKDTIKPEDRGLLHEGLEFVWIFGYATTTSLRQSNILYVPRFRRVSDEALARERARVDTVMDTIFGPLASSQSARPKG